MPNAGVIAGLVRESQAYFREIEEGLARWLQDQGAVGVLAVPRKRLRSIRGAAGVIGLDGLARVAQQLEEAFEDVATGRVPEAQDASPLTNCTRLLKHYLENLAQSDGEISVNEEPLADAERQLGLWRGELIGTVAAEPVFSEEFIDVFREEARGHLLTIAQGLRGLTQRPNRRERLEAVRGALHTLKGAAGVIGLSQASRLAHELEDLIEEAYASPGAMDDELRQRLDATSQALARECGALESSAVEPAAGTEGAPVFRERRKKPRYDDPPGVVQVRVPIDYLDEMGRLMGELTTQRANLEKSWGWGREDNNDAEQALQEIARTASAMEDCLARMRRAPLATIAGRLHRTVRATAERLGKQAGLSIEGDEVEMDRAALEELAGPLEHLLRNAVDHGVEPRDYRVAAGKPAEGRIRVRAYAAGSQVVIEVSDDGEGMDVAAIRRKAIAAGELAEEEALEMSDAETLNLAFSMGLSTAGDVSETSGRGIGLAVVKESLDRLRGYATVESRTGEGTTFRLGLPLSYARPAMMRVIEVGIASGVYAVPAESVTRVLRLAQGSLERAGSKQVLRLGEETVPAIHLEHVLNGAERSTSEEMEMDAHSAVLLVEAGGRRTAWIVDRLGGMPEVSVRKLPDLLGKVRCILGAVVAGDEDVMLVIDAAGLMIEANKPKKAEAEIVYLSSKAS